MTIDQKINLIDVLNKTIKHLQENHERYEWGELSQCNCGFLAQTILGKSETELEPIFKEAEEREVSGDWTMRLAKRKHCQKTGLRISEVFEEMFKLGLTPKDLSNLEYCRSPKVLKEMGFTKSEIEENELNENADFVIKYMQAWVTVLQQEVVCPITE